jgi:hypothetical protein
MRESSEPSRAGDNKVSAPAPAVPSTRLTRNGSKRRKSIPEDGSDSHLSILNRSKLCMHVSKAEKGSCITFVRSMPAIVWLLSVNPQMSS